MNEFLPYAGEVKELLRQQIDACDAVIHIAGECYGQEPKRARAMSLLR